MKLVLDYLLALSENNNREWYHANKKMYKEANTEFEKLIQNLIFEIVKFDKTILHNIPQNITFKLVRDTRFSTDKSPYNPVFRAHISASVNKAPIPVGYFIKIQPNGQSFLGGGLFADMFKDATTRIRDYIVQHPNEWEAVITNSQFSDLFTVKGNKLKNVPCDYDKNHSQAEYLKNKSWYLEYFVSDKELISDDFIEKAGKVFLKMKPFNDFLNEALKGFEMPKRP